MSYFTSPPPGLPGVDVPFNASDFAATLSMTWTVGAGDVSCYRYSLNGKLLSLWVQLNTTTVGGTVAGANLTLKMPNGLLAAKTWAASAICAPAGAASEGCIISAVAGSNLLTILRYAANWVLGSDNTSVNFQVTVEVQ